LGAYNYLSKPFEFNEVLAIATTLLSNGTSRQQPSKMETSEPTKRQAARAETPEHHEFGISSVLGNSPAIQQTKALALKVAKNPTTTILLTGESGSGKDHLAKVIHYSGQRAGRPFVQINVGALPASLFESEVFGHERGSFTGASARKQGLLEMADGGTMYLDEIGDLERTVQVNLLHVLENRSFKRVGGIEEIKIDLRFIAATNANLTVKVAEGAFRQDLFYRLRVVPIEMPALRDREDDVFVLADHFLMRFSQNFGREFKGFSQSAMAKLRSHDWPGNIRELRNVIERACILEEEDIIQPSMLTFEDQITKTPMNSDSADPGFLSDSGMSLQDLERMLIRSALDRAGWNQVKAAQLLGLGRDALRYRMKKFNLL
jgi:DNA-binding NtrC family response regulator